MNKKFVIFTILLFIFLTGCTLSSKEKQADNEKLDIEEFLAELEKQEEQRLKPICDQEMIPAKYASDCYFRELKDCESLSGKKIPKTELEKCLPVFLKEEIENISY
jgi:hypothetical protein